ncbi:hypothetical protein [Polyangium sp. y55x31]|uniref:hypothetical protein n=1 Tax=Polyangium sp. y55x31 TaxID=3042688 RepID=UPI0024824C21|nr:hypothetical protein [Polyangium sp. y55x31]MDI1480374.1 hypothetical protein [Polyangium sp. y55x31]
MAIEAGAIAEALALLRSEGALGEALATFRAPELSAFSGLDRVLLFAARATERLVGAVRDARRVEIVARDADGLLLRAPERNPFVVVPSNLVAPWNEVSRFTITGTSVDPVAYLRLFVQDGRLGADANDALVREATSALARDLGPPSQWEVLALSSPMLEDAYCCAYEACVFVGAGSAVFLAVGMVCG